MPHSVPEHHLVSVFEAVNHARREIYVAATRVLPSQLDADFFGRLPPALAHWRDDQPTIRFLAYSIAKSKARELIAAYAPDSGREAWRVHRQAI